MAGAIAIAATCREDLSIVALVGPQPPEWDTDLPWYSSLDELPDQPDLLIDFTLPEGTRAAASWCALYTVPLLSGVTGLSEDILAVMKKTANSVPVLSSPNLSLGVNLLAELAGRAAAVLDSSTAVIIEDIHHQWKKDAPSGTALMLGETVAHERGSDQSSIEYRSVREGEEIGVHTITFEMAGEEFDLVHRAYDRSIYALGALDAGLWLVRQDAGFYSARDWLAGR